MFNILYGKKNLILYRKIFCDPKPEREKTQKHSKLNKIELFNYYHQFISGLVEKNPSKNFTKELAEMCVYASFLSGCV